MRALSYCTPLTKLQLVQLNQIAVNVACARIDVASNAFPSNSTKSSIVKRVGSSDNLILVTWLVTPRGAISWNSTSIAYADAMYINPMRALKPYGFFCMLSLPFLFVYLT